MARFLAITLLALSFSVLPARVASAQLIADIMHESATLSEVESAIVGKVETTTFQSGYLANEYNGILFQGIYSGDALSAEIRYISDKMVSEWMPATIVRSASDDGSFAGGLRSTEFFSETRYQVRFITEAGSQLNIVASGTFDNRLDEDNMVAVGGSQKSTGMKGTSVVEPPPLITRQDWNAEPFIRGEPVELAPNGVQFMTFHHAAGFSATTREEGLAQLRAIQDLHQNIRGWSDIGYQFVIDRGGRVYQGRPFLDGSTTLQEVPELARGAHVGGANTGNIGICMLGCYHPPEGSHCTDQITQVALDTYVSMFGFLSEVYDVLPDRIRGHRDFSPTACPGDNNYVLLPTLIADVENVILFGNEQPDDFTLERNYPNPVVDNTTIRYFLEEAGVVSVNIYDLAGREIAEVQNSFQEGSRWYTIDYDASGLASGTYYYRIAVDGFAGGTYDETKSFIVVGQ